MGFDSSESDDCHRPYRYQIGSVYGMPRETQPCQLPNEIVVATDFSPASAAALHVATRLAQALKTRVTVLHVFEYINRHAYKAPVDCMVDEIRKDVMKKLVE